MPTVVLESIDSGTSRRGTGETTSLRYRVLDAADYSAALAALAAEAPGTLGGLVRQHWEVQPDADLETLWQGSVEYVEPAPWTKETGDSSFEFDTTFQGGQHLFCGLSHEMSFVPPGKSAPNHDGAINVVRDAGGLRVEGVAVAAPPDALRFSVTRFQEFVDLSVLYALTGCANSVEWPIDVEGVSGTFGVREALFLGASGSKRRRGDWSIRYAFAASPTVVDGEIGDIAGIYKRGMDFLWVEFGEDTDTSALTLVKKPLAAHVERIFREGDFAALGI